MKFRISILMFLSFLVFYSCQKEEMTFTESPEMDNIEKRNDGQAVIFVHWGCDISEYVQGALVFNMETNELISETNEEGNSYIDPIPGTYRVVDPNYGNQQAIVNYPEDFLFDEETGKERKVIAWSIDGKPIYEDE